MGMYEVSVSAGFTASHGVCLPAGGLEPIHPHAWQVTAWFRATQLDRHGFVVDFVTARAALEELCHAWEGRNLNAVIGPADTGTSAEILARELAQRLAAKLRSPVYCLRVTEAPGCQAAYYP
jgi:6-pyruvoyl-tetrahydropterin synthase